MHGGLQAASVPSIARETLPSTFFGHWGEPSMFSYASSTSPRESHLLQISGYILYFVILSLSGTEVFSGQRVLFSKRYFHVLTFEA